MKLQQINSDIYIAYVKGTFFHGLGKPLVMSLVMGEKAVDQENTWKEFEIQEM